MLKVAIVGSGPSGCYVAERLARARKGDVEVDVFDRLPTPFGLVRGGVAPDHQTTKAVARVLARALSQPDVRFFGHVEIGRDLPLSVLREAYDAVVLAVGAPIDRTLGIPGEAVDGVVGSGAFVGWYNGHPDHAGLAVDLTRVRTAVVIGNGNVAIDVARVLARAGCEMARSDLDPSIEATIAAAPLDRIVICGRRGPAEVKFTSAELEELGRLSRACPVISAEDLAAAGGSDNPALAVLRSFSGAPAGARPITIEFAFRASPEAFVPESAGRLAAVRFRGAAGSLEIPAQLAVTCIGYVSEPLDVLQPEDGVFANDGGRIEDALYVVGWAGRGPSGTIPTNRPEAHSLADRILAEIEPGNRPGRAGIASQLARRAVVDFQGWQRIEAAETERAPADRVRRKFRSFEQLVAAASRPGGPAA